MPSQKKGKLDCKGKMRKATERERGILCMHKAKSVRKKATVSGN